MINNIQKMTYFLSILNEIKIRYDEHRPNIIYIAVGSANNEEQQCPPFLLI
jgi:hypothetical protein